MGEPNILTVEFRLTVILLFDRFALRISPVGIFLQFVSVIKEK